MAIKDWNKQTFTTGNVVISLVVAGLGTLICWLLLWFVMWGNPHADTWVIRLAFLFFFIQML